MSHIMNPKTGEIIRPEQQRANGNTPDIVQDWYIELEGFRLDRTGFNPLPGIKPTFDQWMRAGNTLKHLERAVQWWIGDWINYGEARWGEKYAQALEETDYQPGSLRNMASVANRVPHAVRNPAVSWSHHREVASLDRDDQRHFLSRVEADRLSVAALSREIKSWKRERQPKPDGGGYDVLILNPRWQRGVVPHANTINSDDLIQEADNINARARDRAALFLWVPPEHIPAALRAIQAWEFDYKTNFIWPHDEAHSTTYASVTHDHLIMAVRGSYSPHKVPPTIPERPAPRAMARHAKPSAYYTMIRRMYPDARIAVWDGDVWGEHLSMSWKK